MGKKVDLVCLSATMPGRHSGDQVHKVKKTAAPSFTFYCLRPYDVTTEAGKAERSDHLWFVRDLCEEIEARKLGNKPWTLLVITACPYATPLTPLPLPSVQRGGDTRRLSVLDR